jgi:hypothetical protein
MEIIVSTGAILSPIELIAVVTCPIAFLPHDSRSFRIAACHLYRCKPSAKSSID